jgi:hypothetical protein
LQQIASNPDNSSPFLKESQKTLRRYDVKLTAFEPVAEQIREVWMFGCIWKDFGTNLKTILVLNLDVQILFPVSFGSL